MSGPIFDYDDGDIIFSTGGNMGIDSSGDLNIRMGSNMSMNLSTGEMHFTSSWDDDDDDDDW